MHLNQAQARGSGTTTPSRPKPPYRMGRSCLRQCLYVAAVAAGVIGLAFAILLTFTFVIVPLYQHSQDVSTESRLAKEASTMRVPAGSKFVAERRYGPDRSDFFGDNTSPEADRYYVSDQQPGDLCSQVLAQFRSWATDVSHDNVGPVHDHGCMMTGQHHKDGAAIYIERDRLIRSGVLGVDDQPIHQAHNAVIEIDLQAQS